MGNMGTDMDFWHTCTLCTHTMVSWVFTGLISNGESFYILFLSLFFKHFPLEVLQKRIRVLNSNKCDKSSCCFHPTSTQSTANARPLGHYLCLRESESKERDRMGVGRS